MISFIIPVFNRSELTNQLLDKLFPIAKQNEIIIVDNGSTDNTPDLVRFYLNRYYKDIQYEYIQLPENKGFGYANNFCAKFAHGDIICFLSNDVVINDDFIATLEILNYDSRFIYGSRLISFATGWNKFLELESPLPYLEGWCMWMKKDVFSELGRWDERYFTDYEDLDFSYNAVQHGYELKQIDLPLTHLGGQTGQLLEGGRLQYTLDSQRKFCSKWGLTI